MTGKIEQKLRIIGNRLPGNLDLGDLAAVLDLLWGLLSAGYPEGQYQLAGPCERLPDGTLAPPYVARWPSGVGGLAELSAKLDALAELLQAHKEMGQPVCVKQREGRPVTVVLREVL